MARGEAVGLLGSPTPRVGFLWHREAACGALDVGRDTGQRDRTDATGWSERGVKAGSASTPVGLFAFQRPVYLRIVGCSGAAA